MKRFLAVFYLVFLLWLLLFPPWDRYPYSSLKLDTVSAGIGHHWRFSVPKAPRSISPIEEEYWSHQVGQPVPSFEQREAMQDKLPPIVVIEEVRTAAIDFRIMLYDSLVMFVFLCLVAVSERHLLALWEHRSKVLEWWQFYCADSIKTQEARNRSPLT